MKIGIGQINTRVGDFDSNAEKIVAACEKFANRVKIIEPKYKENIQNLASTVVLCVDDEIKVLRQGSVKI